MERERLTKKAAIMSKSNVIKFYPKSAADNPDNILEQAIGDYSEVVIVGYNKKGQLDTRASNGVKMKDILWMIEQLKITILNIEE